MSWVSLVGAVLVAAVVWDVFHTLWHPSGQGRLSHALMAGVWWLTARLGRHVRRLAGPLAMASVILAWAALVVLGGALVYWPHLPDGFSYGPGLAPARGGELLDALYISMVSVTTLGFGDIVPTAGWLRLLVPAQAMIGFALLTAAVSWGLQVYPALTRRRSLALRLAALRDTGTVDVLDDLTPVTASRILDAVAAEVAQIRVDLTQYTESYYFQETSPQVRLASTIGYAHHLATTGGRSPHQDVRHAAATLASSLADLALLLEREFLRTGHSSTGEVLAAYTTAQSDR